MQTCWPVQRLKPYLQLRQKKNWWQYGWDFYREPIERLVADSISYEDISDEAYIQLSDANACVLLNL